MQQILSYARKAIEYFDMIQDGDKIAIGVSGGKDSTTLLLCLHGLQKFLPVKFELLAVTINPVFDNFDTSDVEKLCKDLDIQFVTYQSSIKEVVFDIRNEKNPCSLCANLRRGILHSVAKEHNCNKVALGHHQDDVLETFFLSLFYEGHIHTFAPVTYLDRDDLYIIRPLVFTPEKEIRHFIKHSGLHIISKCCEKDGYTKREYMKELIKKLALDMPHIRASIFGAIKRSNIKGWNVKGGTNEE